MATITIDVAIDAKIPMQGDSFDNEANIPRNLHKMVYSMAKGKGNRLSLV